MKAAPPLGGVGGVERIRIGLASSEQGDAMGRHPRVFKRLGDGQQGRAAQAGAFVDDNECT